MKKQNIDDEYVLNLVYDFVLNSDITDNERKIGYKAKLDLEHKRYVFFVLNKLVVSFQREAVTNGNLSKKASEFYSQINDLLVNNKPIGTNLGSFVIQSSYLD